MNSTQLNHGLFPSLKPNHHITKDEHEHDSSKLLLEEEHNSDGSMFEASQNYELPRFGTMATHDNHDTIMDKMEDASSYSGEYSAGSGVKSGDLGHQYASSKLSKQLK